MVNVKVSISISLHIHEKKSSAGRNERPAVFFLSLFFSNRSVYSRDLLYVLGGVRREYNSNLVIIHTTIVMSNGHREDGRIVRKKKYEV